MSKKSGLPVFLMLATILLLAINCSSPPGPSAQSPVGITDQAGRTIYVDNIPQRIISLAPSNTEILYALGLADRVVGVTDYDNYPPEVKQKPSIGGFSTPNIEKVISLSPDLVLATSMHEKQVVPQLESRGLTVMVLDPKNIDEILSAITMVGRVTGKEKEASELVAGMQGRIKVITDKTGNLSDSQKPRVLYVTWHDPLMTAGSGTLHDELIRKGGGINVAGDLSGFADITLEAVVEANPEVIIAGVGMGSGAEAPFQFALNEPRLANTDARLNNRVYAVNTDLTGRDGPRIVDALEQFARFIHSELFKDNK